MTDVDREDGGCVHGSDPECCAACDRDRHVYTLPPGGVSGGSRVAVAWSTPTAQAPYCVQISHEGHLISLTREGARDLCMALLEVL